MEPDARPQCSISGSFYYSVAFAMTAGQGVGEHVILGWFCFLPCSLYIGIFPGVGKESMIGNEVFVKTMSGGDKDNCARKQ